MAFSIGPYTANQMLVEECKSLGASGAEVFEDYFLGQIKLRIICEGLEKTYVLAQRDGFQRAHIKQEPVVMSPARMLRQAISHHEMVRAEPFEVSRKFIVALVEKDITEIKKLAAVKRRILS